MSAMNDATATTVPDEPAPVARTVQVHEMSMAGGIMRMAEVKGGAQIAPGQSLKLQPGGWHLMLIGLKAPVAAEAEA